MIRTKSFQITDHDGINALLDMFSLSPGSNILVSNGTILLQYDDGEPITDAQKVNKLKIDLNKRQAELEEIEHSDAMTSQSLADHESDLSMIGAEISNESSIHPRKAGRCALRKSR